MDKAVHCLFIWNSETIRTESGWTLFFSWTWKDAKYKIIEFGFCQLSSPDLCLRLGTKLRSRGRAFKLPTNSSLGILLRTNSASTLPSTSYTARSILSITDQWLECDKITDKMWLWNMNLANNFLTKIENRSDPGVIWTRNLLIPPVILESDALPLRHGVISMLIPLKFLLTQTLTESRKNQGYYYFWGEVVYKYSARYVDLV